MFQTARPNSRAYIFFKGKPYRLETGFITNTPVIRPKYSVPATFGAPQETVLDLTIKTDTGSYNFSGIPANLEIADTFCNGEAAVISDNKEAISAEILSIRQKSQDTIDSAPFHREVIASCDTAYSQLHPEYAEKQERDAEFNSLKSTVNDLTAKMDLLLEKLDTKI